MKNSALVLISVLNTLIDACNNSISRTSDLLRFFQKLKHGIEQYIIEQDEEVIKRIED